MLLKALHTSIYTAVLDAAWRHQKLCMLLQHHICWYFSTGPAEEEHKVYLSAATLLVLPPTLIPHWLNQIRVHLKPNTLRVAVLAGDRASADEAVDGNYKLLTVITRF